MRKYKIQKLKSYFSNEVCCIIYFYDMKNFIQLENMKIDIILF